MGGVSRENEPRATGRPGAVIEFQSWCKPISSSAAMLRRLTKILVIIAALGLFGS